MRIKIICIICCILLVSCVQKKKNDILAESIHPQEIYHEEKNNEIITSVNKNNETIQINIGDIFIEIPNDYHIGYFDGDNYKYTLINDITTEKYFHFMVFNKNKDFDGADTSYESKNVPLLQNFINGTSNDMSKFHGRYRRNSYNNINVAERLILGEFEIISIMFERQISFIYNDLVYIFTINIHNIDKIFIKEMPEYFEVKYGYFSNEDPYGWITDKEEKLYRDYMEYLKLPQPIDKLFRETDKVFGKIKMDL
ncbi:MAG: hypothetical protein LBV17_01615 [Treponema sp.]|jgi:hypothetical protein|nr:hypothetical protein [Treponema sp.]